MLPVAIEKQPLHILPPMLTPEARVAVDVADHAPQFAPPEAVHQAPAPLEIESSHDMTPSRHEIAPSPDQIAAEAYNLYLARGCQDGFDVEDWLAAEELLRSRHA